MITPPLLGTCSCPRHCHRRAVRTSARTATMENLRQPREYVYDMASSFPRGCAQVSPPGPHSVDPDMDEISWSLIVPVKGLTLAKSRLAAAAGEHREALVLAMACDTVAAALGCSLVASV